MKDMLNDHTFATHIVAGAWSAVFSSALIYPLDTLKVLLQVGSNPNKKLTSSQVLYRVKTLSGSLGLYSGLGWFTVGRTFGAGTRFSIYELLTSFYKDGRKDNYVSVSEALMAGIAAGAVESLLTSPFELIKLRAQVSSAFQIPQTASNIKANDVSPLIGRLLHGYFPDTKVLNNSVGLLSILSDKHPNLVKDMRQYPWMMTGCGRPPSVYHVKRPSQVISLEGWHTLWKGLRSGIVRDSVFSGIFFSIWQLLHEAMLTWKAVGMTPIPRHDDEVGPLSPFYVSLAAGFSGSIAAAASHSFDTAKSRSQCTVVPKYLSKERKFLKWQLPGKRFERWTGIHPADRSLLFRGISLRMARSGLGSFLLVGSYFFSIDQFPLLR
ncbi:unnamed protein product [Cuscuta epithymum]|uniref:Uncharacterized protein n=1 Tax=Cuscuta epithymum TaxID=186058 RepID=A0AAV0ER36_9ASTE|nr:unnamed protein product [Cuscuta epithymum]